MTLFKILRPPRSLTSKRVNIGTSLHTLYSPRNMQNFQTSVITCNIDWTNIYYCHDVNEAFNKFESHLIKCYKGSFPLVRLSHKRARDKKMDNPGH